MSKPKINSMLLVLPLLAIIILFFVVILAGGSAGGTLASGRSVVIHSDAISLSSSFSADTASIDTAGKRIVVHPTSLTVDGVTVAKIDPGVNDVQVRVKRGVVTFVADGIPVDAKRSLR